MEISQITQIIDSILVKAALMACKHKDKQCMSKGGGKRSHLNLLVLSIFFVCLTVEPLAASNTIQDIEMLSRDESIMLAILFDIRPEYSLNPVSMDTLILTIYGATTSPSLEVKVIDMDGIDLEPSGVSDLSFQIKLSKPAGSIDCSWLDPERLLFINIGPLDRDDMEQEQSSELSTLDSIRFGFMDNATRMVMSFDRMPAWKVLCQDNTEIAIHLKADSDDDIHREYGPVKRLKHVAVRRQGSSSMDIALQLESPMNYVKIFWMGVGKRLIMDLYEETYRSKYDEFFLESVSDHVADKSLTKEEDIKEAVDRAKYESPLHESDSSLSAGEPQPVHRQDKKEANVTTKGKKEETGQAESVRQNKHILRIKIPKMEKERSSEQTTENTEITGSQVKPFIVEPKQDIILPVSFDEKELVKKLSSGEAFLFGRIQEARDISDFEKGIILTSRFLAEYPESPLFEETAFWRGDFYYGMWNSGNREVSHKVLISYNYALDRFGSSRYVPLVYIKMAQVNSFVGADFQAIGYLSLVVGQHLDSPYLPLAYLTRGKTYLDSNLAEKAIEDFKFILDRFPDSPYSVEARFWIANYFHIMGMYEEAGLRLDEIDVSDSDFFLKYPEYLFLCAKNHIYLENYDSAREYLFKAVNIGHQPESIDLLLSRIGDTYHNQDRIDEAEKYFEMVMEYYPGSEGASISRLRVADYFSDIAMLNDLSNEEGSEAISDLAQLEKGYQLFEKEQYSASMDSLRDLISKSIQTKTSKDARQLFQKASEKRISLLFDARKYSEVIELYQAEKQWIKDKMDPESMLLVARSFHELNLNEDSVIFFSLINIVDLKHPSRADYLYDFASTYREKGDFEAAQRLLKQNISDRSLDTKGQYKISMLLADIYKQQARYRESYQQYQYLLNNKKFSLGESDLAKVYYNMGRVLNLEKSYEKARKILRLSLILATERGNESAELIQSIHIEIAKGYYNEGNFQQAVKSFEQGFALGYSPGEVDYWNNRFRLGIAYMEMGAPLKAESIIKEVNDEGDSVIIQQRAQIRLGSIML
ncbi:MAG: hypothetical protein JRI86_02835, partial [Deltaproteobacteria bacterium]|nr:hypothetical protein [Deltaproteobacteria bacterium]